MKFHSFVWIPFSLIFVMSCAETKTESEKTRSAKTLGKAVEGESSDSSPNILKDIGTAPIGTAPIGTAPIGTAPIGTAPIGTAPIGSVTEKTLATDSTPPIEGSDTVVDVAGVADVYGTEEPKSFVEIDKESVPPVDNFVANPLLEELSILGVKGKFKPDQIRLNIGIADKFTTIPWPQEGVVAKVPGICKKDLTQFKVSIIYSNFIFSTDQKNSGFGGKSVLPNEVLLGINRYLRFSRYRYLIIRAAANFSCPNGNLEILGVKLNPKFKP